MNVKTMSVTEPTVFITRDRMRVKQYNNEVVYLEDGNEFELELFNPTNQKILAKIELNDLSLGSGIVLRPGERVFLERYLNEAKKFIFETYHVDAKDPNVDRAIQDNGKIKVEFFMEYSNPMIWSNSSTIYLDNSPNVYYNNGTGNPNYGSPSFTTNINEISFGGGDITAGESKDFTLTNCSCFVNEFVETKETGRIEKGSNSDQTFEYDATQFNAWPTWTQVWKILPKSQKAITKEEIKVFCPSCGAKRKKSSFKFCPHCGNKF